MKTIAFFVRGVPRAQPRHRARLFRDKTGTTRIAHFIPSNHPVRLWVEMFDIEAAKNAPQAAIQGPISVTMRFSMPRPKSHFRKNGELKPGAPVYHSSKPDFDNLAKTVCDRLKATGFYRDDSQVVISMITKTYAPAAENCGVMVSIAEVTKDLIC